MRLALAFSVLFIGTSSSMAAEVVALGASNTAGKGGRPPMGVERGRAYPAQLQAMLAAQGCRVRVANAGVAGDTTDGMLRRLPGAVQKDTKVLVLQPGGNDARQGGGDRAGNIAAMQAFAQQRGITVVMFERPASIASGAYQTADGLHYTAEGHAQFAAYLLPQVQAAACR